MDKTILYTILKFEQSLNTADPRIRRNYYGNFLKSLNEYNKINNTNHVVTSSMYDTFFAELIKDSKIIKSCCQKYKVT